MKSFIYPGNFKEPKTFLFLRVFDLVIAGILVVISVIYAAKNFSFLPLLYPSLFIILKVRFLEDGSNMWDKILDLFNYLIDSQQIYFWEIRRKS